MTHPNASEDYETSSSSSFDEDSEVDFMTSDTNESDQDEYDSDASNLGPLAEEQEAKDDGNQNINSGSAIPRLKTPRQTIILLEAFEKDHNLGKGSSRLARLSAETGLDEHTVHNWFTNRRTRTRKAERLKRARKGVVVKRCTSNMKEWMRQKEILLAAYGKDQTYPKRRDERLSELCTATGLDAEAVQKFFSHRRDEYDSDASNLGPLAGEQEAKDDGNKNINSGSATPRLKTPRQTIILLEAFEKDNNLGKGSSRLARLSAETGLDEHTVHNWFARRRTRTRKAERLKRARKGVVVKRCTSNMKEWMRQKEVGILTYGKDQTYPKRRDERLKELCTATGLDAEAVQKFFSHRRQKDGFTNKSCKTPEQLKILFAAFEADPSRPGRDSDRLKDLSESTGLDPHTIRLWFGNIRAQRKQKLNREARKSQKLTPCLGKAKPLVKKELAKKDQDEDHNYTVATLTVKSKSNKTPEQLRILTSAFEEDATMPLKHSERLEDLCAQTGLKFGVIQDWFKHTQRSIRNGPAENTRKTAAQLDTLYESFLKDSTVPKRARLKEMCAATGLEAVNIQTWFLRSRKLSQHKLEELFGNETITKMKDWEKKKEILRGLYDKDPTYPKSGCQRLTELSKLVGITPDHVQEWFRNETNSIAIKAKRAAETAASKKEIMEKKNEIAMKYTTFHRKNWKTPEQTEILRAAFKEDSSYPKVNSDRLKKLCEETGLDEPSVQKWFNSQYEKERKMQGQMGESKDGQYSGTGRPFRARRTPEQTEILLKEFSKDPTTPSYYTVRMQRICDATGLQCTSIQGWFGRQRTLNTTETKIPQKDKKKSKFRRTSGKKVQKAKKCAICESTTSRMSMIASLKEAKSMDMYFGSYLVHFLNYTAAVRVCMKHRMECKNVKIEPLAV